MYLLSRIFLRKKTSIKFTENLWTIKCEVCIKNYDA